MDIALMIEGQLGLNWERWWRIARFADEAGYAGLYRSDHFVGGHPPDQDSLELWISLAWLAEGTSRLEFGPLVTPVSFRHPAILARMAAAVDDLSGGRLYLGLGAGWLEREHDVFGLDLLPIDDRFQRFEEALEVVSRLLHSDEPSRFEGRFYRLRDAVLLPRPSRPGGPPLVIGGNGPRRTLPLAARFADEWNGVHISPARFAELSRLLDEEARRCGRDPAAIRRTVMLGLDREGDRPEDGRLSGPPARIREQLAAYCEAGAQRAMIQWLDLDDMQGLEEFTRTVLPGSSP